MTDNKLKYVEIEPRSRAELEEAFASHDEIAVWDAMYSAAQHEPDWRWTQGRLLQLLAHKSTTVRTAALIALGELALFQGQVDLEIVLPEVNKLANDPDLAPWVEDCIADIKSRITIN